MNIAGYDGWRSAASPMPTGPLRVRGRCDNCGKDVGVDALTTCRKCGLQVCPDCDWGRHYCDYPMR